MLTALTPIYRILKGDVDITNHFNDRVTQIEVKIASGGGDSDTFQISLDDRDFKIELPQLGANLSIELGYVELGMSEVGQYQISEIYLDAPPKTMRLVGLSAGAKSVMKSPVVKEHDDKTIGEIVEDIAKKGGLKAEVAPEFRDKKIPYLNQFQSGFHLLHELENRFNALAKVEFGKLTFAKRDSGETFSGKTLLTVAVKPEHVTHISAKITEANGYTVVKAAWHDPNTNGRKFEEEDVGSLGAQKREQGETGGGQTPFVMNKMFNSKEEAIAAAKSKAAQLRRAKGEVTVTLAKGDPWIRAQMPIKVIGFRDGLDGSYIIDTVTHTYVKDAGIMTTILAKPSGEEVEADAPASSENFISPQPGVKLGNTVPDPAPAAPKPAPEAPVPAQPAPEQPAPPPEARPTTGEILDHLREWIMNGDITTPGVLREQLHIEVRGKIDPEAPGGAAAYNAEVAKLDASIKAVVEAANGPFNGTAEQRDQAFITIVQNLRPAPPRDVLGEVVDDLRKKVKDGIVTDFASFENQLSLYYPFDPRLMKNRIRLRVGGEVAQAHGGKVEGSQIDIINEWIATNK